jgi:hypothetical protein
MKELWGECRELHKEERHIIYSSPKTGVINVAVICSTLEGQEKRIQKSGQKTEGKKNTLETSE